MATVGQALRAPEAGWRRYDSNSGIFTYTDSWTTITHSEYYLGNAQATSTLNASVRFTFYGTKIRVVGSLYYNDSTSIVVKVDGVQVDTFSTNQATLVRGALVYERTNMNLGTHVIELINNDAVNNFTFDCVDTDETGYILIPTLGERRTSLTDLQVGDYIECEYTATSNAAGAFANLGAATKSEIPVASSATPNGTFNFICVERKPGKGGLCIADRNIQSSISWANLNTAKYIAGKVCNITNIPNLTANTDKGFTAFASSEFNASYSAYLAFDKVKTNAAYPWHNVSGNSGYLGINYPLAVTNIYYTITTYDTPTYAPKDFTLQGSNDGSNWTIIDSRTNETTWAAFESRTYQITTPGSYTWYKLVITSNNGAGYLSIGELEFTDQKLVLIRSISGGCAYADANGYLSFTNQDYGAFPTSNEWDKYIVNSSLSGKITAGDDNVWHWNQALVTWAKETAVNSMVALAGSPTYNNTYRICRGYSDFYGLDRIDAAVSTQVSAAMAFRPVLEFHQDGTLFY